MIASPHYSFLSSTGVKEMATFGGDVSDLVPGPVATALADRLPRQVGFPSRSASRGRRIAKNAPDNGIFTKSPAYT